MYAAADVAWAAGLFEGEGSIGIYRGRRGSTPKLQLSSTDEDVVLTFHARAGIGAVNGPYQSKKPNHKPYWVWSVTSFEKVQALLAMFWPWLCARRRQRAEDVLHVSRGTPPLPTHRTRCPKNHPLSGDNLYVNCRGKRCCRICMAAIFASYRRRNRKRLNDYQRARRAKLKEQAR